jgi:5-methylcytosine-specific restriction endonuclease McrBC regulatory subunit McrC
VILKIKDNYNFNNGRTILFNAKKARKRDVVLVDNKTKELPKLNLGQDEFELSEKSLLSNENFHFTRFKKGFREVDDDLIFSAKTNNNSVSFKTGNYIGVFVKNNNRYEISSRFGEVFLQRMLNFANDIYASDVLPVSIDKSQNENPFLFIASFLFTNSLLKEYGNGLPKHYVNNTRTGNKFKGRLDIKQYIKKETPFKGKIPCKVRDFIVCPHIANVLQTAIKVIAARYPSMIGTSLKKISANLAQFQSNVFVQQEEINRAKSSKSLNSSNFEGYNKVLKYAEMLLNSTGQINWEKERNEEAYGYFIDISELFEVYLEKILARNMHDYNVISQLKIKVYPSMNYGRNIYPDLVLINKNTDEVIVFDAKYKSYKYTGGMIDRSDFYQIHSYMYSFDKIKAGGLIYPQWNKEGSTPQKLFGNQNNQIEFAMEGLLLKRNVTSFSEVEDQELSFISRIKEIV